jgi:hypothetical protein
MMKARSMSKFNIVALFPPVSCSSYRRTPSTLRSPRAATTPTRLAATPSTLTRSPCAATTPAPNTLTATTRRRLSYCTCTKPCSENECRYMSTNQFTIKAPDSCRGLERGKWSEWREVAQLPRRGACSSDASFLSLTVYRREVVIKTAVTILSERMASGNRYYKQWPL